MRRIALLATALLLVASVSAFARGPADVVHLEGTISAIDSGAFQLLVNDVVVQVTPTTLIKIGPELVVSFDDLQVGMTVMVCGHWDEDVLVARQVTVKYGGK